VLAIAILSSGAPAITIIGGNGTIIGLFASNSTKNLSVSNQNYSAFSGSYLLMVGCFVDEGGTTTTFTASKGVVCQGCSFYTASSAPGHAVDIDATSIIRFEGCTFGPYYYSILSSCGLVVAAGGVAYVSDCDFRSNAGGHGIVNNGVIYDGLGNSVDAGGISGSGTISQKTIAMP
jgi:hypothetical protein